MNNIITISGDPGSGKSTVRNALKKYYEGQGKKVILYSVGDIFRDLAEKHGMTVTEFNQFLEKNNCNVDENIESTVKKYGQKIIEENDDSKIYIIDSRLAWHEIPESFKIRLTTTDRIAGQRVFEDKKRGEEDKYATLEEAIEKTRERKRSEKERYIELYGEGANLEDENNFDLVIGTSFAEVKDIVDIITRCFEARRNGKNNFSKNWMSPKEVIPGRGLREMIYGGNCVQDISHNMKLEGYRLNESMLVVKYDDINWIIDGNHRFLAALETNQGLIPFGIAMMNDDKEAVINYVKSSVYYFRKDFRDYESIFERIGKAPFSYAKVFGEKKYKEIISGKYLEEDKRSEDDGNR